MATKTGDPQLASLALTLNSSRRFLPFLSTLYAYVLRLDGLQRRWPVVMLMVEAEINDPHPAHHRAGGYFILADAEAGKIDLHKCS